VLARDGDIVDVDGTSPVLFDLPVSDYFVAVRHRNHLGCMTYGVVSVADTVDFTTSDLITWGVDARKALPNGAMALWEGDVTGDGEVKYTGANNDRDPILQAIGGVVPTNVSPGYNAADCTMDGTVKYTGGSNDRDPILQNVGGVVPTATRLEQLP